SEENFMKHVLKQTLFSLFIISVAIITWLIALPFLPNSIPMQYSNNGDVNWSANRFVAFVISIAIMLFCYIVTNIKLSKDKDQDKFSNMYSLNSFINPLFHAFLYFIFFFIIFNVFVFLVFFDFLIFIFYSGFLFIYYRIIWDYKFNDNNCISYYSFIISVVLFMVYISKNIEFYILNLKRVENEFLLVLIMGRLIYSVFKF